MIGKATPPGVGRINLLLSRTKRIAARPGEHHPQRLFFDSADKPQLFSDVGAKTGRFPTADDSATRAPSPPNNTRSLRNNAKILLLEKTVPSFLEGGGEMGALMRTHNWDATPFGPPERWPQSLKSTLSICLKSSGVCALYWGDEFRVLYNDSYAPALAERHPMALGMPLKEVWSEIWHVLGPQMTGVIDAGKGIAVENQPLLMRRRGRSEETFWSYSFTPIRGEAEDFVGIFVTALDATKQVLAQRRNTAEREQMWAMSQDLLAVARSDGVLTTVNSAWTSLLGWREDELFGQSFAKFVHPDDLEITLSKFAEIEHAPLTAPYEYRLLHKNGTHRWFSWTATFSDGLVYANGRHTTLMHEQAASLSEARVDARLREEFIAVLGHDLRNPLGSIDAAARMLMREPQTDKSKQILRLAQGSLLRMSGLIDNVLDFARGRLGGGIRLSRDAQEPLEATLDQVVNELRISTPKRIDVDFQMFAPVMCDRLRIGQLVSNLVGNALTHGAPDTPVRVRAATGEGFLEISVSNDGEPIAPMAMERLFQPFFRGEVSASRHGLGLGLHIASEIAKAHGGSLVVDSSAKETRFIFRMPIV